MGENDREAEATAKREKKRAYKRAWYEKNRERLRVLRLPWRDYTPERKERMRLYRKRMKDKTSDRTRVLNAAWRARNVEKVRGYRANNPEKIRAAIADWRARNRAKLCDYSAKRRAMKKGAAVGRVPTWWVRVLRADPCSYCGAVGGTLDHVAALDDGGTHSEDNLVGACLTCNVRKNARPLFSWLLSRDAS